MARSVVFVNDSGTDWILTRFGGLVVPATDVLDVTALLSDTEIVNAIQQGLNSEFDASHYIQRNGVALSAAESANYGAQGQAGGIAYLDSSAEVDDTQHGSRSGGALHADATAVVAGFMTSAEESKLAGVATNAARMHDYIYGRSTQVPGHGTLQLLGPGDTTVGIRINRVGTLTGASIQVDVVDASRTFDLQIHQNGGSVATVSLPLSTLGASRSDLNIAVAVGDLMQAFVVRTAGVGASTFANILGMIEVQF